MSASLEFCRRALLTSAALLVVVAIVLVLGVIPTVKADTFSGANVDGSVIAFWVSAGAHLLAAAPLVQVALPTARPSRRPTFAMIVVVPLVLLLALVLLDAAGAFAGHGAEVRLVPRLLLPGTGADLVAAGLIVAAWARFPRVTAGAPAS